jgi:hypothetical protein
MTLELKGSNLIYSKWIYVRQRRVSFLLEPQIIRKSRGYESQYLNNLNVTLYLKKSLRLLTQRFLENYIESAHIKRRKIYAFYNI